jgi:Leucine-rich repeat (LRR) protein
MSGNRLKDISSLSSLTHLLTLKVDKNQLTSAGLDKVCIVSNTIILIAHLNAHAWW